MMYLQSNPRKVYICKQCEGVYADAPVSQCDCMPEKNEFYEGYIVLIEDKKEKEA